MIEPCSDFWLSFLILKVQRTSMSSKSSFGALEDAGGFWLWFGILIWSLIWSLVFYIPMVQIFVLFLHFEGANNIHVLEVLIRALKDAGGSWHEFCLLKLIWIWSRVFDIPMIQILALYLDFEGAKNIYVLEVLIWGFGGGWMFVTGA